MITLNADEISFFSAKLIATKPRKGDDESIAPPSFKLSCCNDAIVGDYGHYYFSISRMQGKQDCEEWGCSYDCRYKIYVSHVGFVGTDANQHIGEIISYGFYVSKEKAWRGLVARWRRKII